MWNLILYLRKLFIMQVYLTYFVINHVTSFKSFTFRFIFAVLWFISLTAGLFRERLLSNKFCLQIIRNKISGNYFTSFASFQNNSGVNAHTNTCNRLLRFVRMSTLYFLRGRRHCYKRHYFLKLNNACDVQFSWRSTNVKLLKAFSAFQFNIIISFLI